MVILGFSRYVQRDRGGTHDCGRGFPALRLVRHAIGSYTLEGLAPGEWREEKPGTADERG